MHMCMGHAFCLIWKYVSLFRPLHIAASNGLVSVVQELITKGASLLAVDNKGKFQ